MSEDFSRANEILQKLGLANDNIKYIDITNGNKTTKYAETKERVKAFRNVFPEGSIATKLVEWDKENGNITFKAEIYNENGNLLSTGYACENVNVGFVNKGGSALENCETSSISRALGFLGFGIVGGIASAEVMQQVAHQKEERDGMKICRRCNGTIKDAVNSKNELIDAETIAKESLRVYGDAYCLRCLAEIEKAGGLSFLGGGKK